MSHTNLILERIKSSYAHQPTFLQAVEELLSTIQPYLDKIEVDEGDRELAKQLMAEASASYTQSTDNGTQREQTAFETGVKMLPVSITMFVAIVVP